MLSDRLSRRESSGFASLRRSTARFYNAAPNISSSWTPRPRTLPPAICCKTAPSSGLGPRRGEPRHSSVRPLSHYAKLTVPVELRPDFHALVALYTIVYGRLRRSIDNPRRQRPHPAHRDREYRLRWSARSRRAAILSLPRAERSIRLGPSYGGFWWLSSARRRRPRSRSTTPTCWPRCRAALRTWRSGQSTCSG